jgi:hypothetical protein
MYYLSANEGRGDSMCQQWIGVFGLVLDIAGFLLIAKEWLEMFQRYITEGELRISEFYARYRARQEGKERTEYEMDEDNYSLGKHMGAALEYDVRRRGRMFYCGTALIVAGFVGQALAAVPGGIPGTPFQNCSIFSFAPK